MSWDRRINLHLDVDAPAARCLITSETDSSLLNTPPEFVAGDKIAVRLHFWRRGAVPGTLESIDPGTTSTFRLSGRPNGVPSGSELLFLAATFTEIATGVWETTLDLHTTELADHLEDTPAGAKTITCEVEVRDAADSSRRSLQFAARVLPEVYDAALDDPTALPSPIGDTAPLNVTLGVPQKAEVTLTATATVSEVVAVGVWTGEIPISFEVALSSGDTPDIVAAKCRDGILAGIASVGLEASISVYGTGPMVGVEKLYAVEYDALFQVTIVSEGAGPYLVESPEPALDNGVPGPPTVAPPHLRVAGGFLYVQEAGIWKKAALSAL